MRERAANNNKLAADNKLSEEGQAFPSLCGLRTRSAP